MKHIFLASLFLIPFPLFAHNNKNFEECTRYQIKETYHEGYYDSHGNYVSGYVSSNRVKVPCVVSQASKHYHNDTKPAPASYIQYNQTPKCNGSGTLGGLLGGGLAASLSKKDAYGWSIPLGAVLGAGLGRSGCIQ